MQLDIPKDKLLPMTLRSDNSKACRCKPLTDRVVIKALHVYNRVLNFLRLGKYEENYTILLQIKSLIRCIWRTWYKFEDYPNVQYLNSISSGSITVFSPVITPEMKMLTMDIKARQKNINPEELLSVERSLIPAFKYDFNRFLDNKLWDEYLMIFDNILLTENMEIRERLKIYRDEEFKKLNEEFAPSDRNKPEYRDRLKEITTQYEYELSEIKDGSVFNVVNYVNYLYYQGDEYDKRFAVSVVLLRLSCFDGEPNYNELEPHDCHDYEEFIRSIYETYVTEDDGDDVLLNLYVAIAIYRYQFVHKSIATYDHEYIEAMISYKLGTMRSLSDTINGMYSDVMHNTPLLRILLPDEAILRQIRDRYYIHPDVKFNILHSFVLNTFHEDDIKRSGIIDIRDKHVRIMNIRTIYNKISPLNLDILRSLDEIDEKTLHDVFVEMYTSGAFNRFTGLILEYLSHRDNYDDLHNRLLEACPPSRNEQLGQYCVLFNDIAFFDKANNKATSLTTACQYIDDMSPPLVATLIQRAKALETTVRSSYDRYCVQEALAKLEDSEQK